MVALIHHSFLNTSRNHYRKILTNSTKSTKCTKNCNVYVQHSTEMILSFSTTTPNHMLPDRPFKSWTKRIMKFYFIHHTRQISLPLITSFSSGSIDYFFREKCFKSQKRCWNDIQRIYRLQNSRILLNRNYKTCFSMVKVHWLQSLFWLIKFIWAEICTCKKIYWRQR